MSSLPPRFASLLSASLLVSLASALACHVGGSTRPGDRPPALSLRAYDLASERGTEVQGVLKTLLNRGKDAPSAGAVALAPSGQLMVAAPEEFHTGVEELLSRLKSGRPESHPGMVVDYWVVVGRPAAEATPGGQVAPEIAETLNALQKAQGPMKLVLAERVKLRSLSGEHSRMEGRGFTVLQRASAEGDDVLIDIEITHKSGRGRLEGRARIPVGEAVVLGQAGFELRDLGEPFYASGADPSAPSSPATIFYALKADTATKGP